MGKWAPRWSLREKGDIRTAGDFRAGITEPGRGDFALPDVVVGTRPAACRARGAAGVAPSQIGDGGAVDSAVKCPQHIGNAPYLRPTRGRVTARDFGRGQMVRFSS